MKVEDDIYKRPICGFSERYFLNDFSSSFYVYRVPSLLKNSNSIDTTQQIVEIGK